MRKIYHLSTCNTCQRIIKELNNGEGFEIQDVKTNPISSEQLDAMYEKTGSYEGLFNRRAQKYRSLGLKEMNLTEADYRKYILEEYTFLKRPAIWIDEDLFVGNAKKTIAAAKEKLGL